MTSLAHQLKRLALPQNDPNLLTRREVASLLFDPKDAASMDRSTFYALGCTGLEELLGIEPAFLEFQDTLFSRASLTLERSVQSKEVNEKLDSGISLFLTRLCPYFLLRPAHKCIEWLVHRFHIQLYNADSLLACTLPYHDTNIFVRVLQLLRIKDPTSRWNWLQCLQKPGVPLSRGALITHCYTDLSFMDFICTTVTRSIQAYSGCSGSGSQLRVIFSFYASTIVPALDAVDKVSDTIVSKLLPYVQRGLKSSLIDYKAATYMIVCQLAVKVVMEASLVDSLAVHISKSLVKEPVLAQEGLGCLIVLLQNQKEGAAGAFSRLCSMPALASTLQVMAAAHDVTPLLRYLLPHLVTALFTCIRPSSALKTCLLSTSVCCLWSDCSSPGESDGWLVCSCQVLCRSVNAAVNMAACVSLCFSSIRYCGALDAVLSGHVTDISRSEQKRLFHQFLSLSMSSGKYQILGNSDTSLLLSLKHPQPSVRVSAMEHLMDITTSGQLHPSHFLFASFWTWILMVHVVSCLLSLLHRVDLSVAEHWLPVLMDVVRLLSDPRLGKGDVELVQRVGWRLLPFLVITAATPDSAQLCLASCIARSSILTQHPLSLSWAQGIWSNTRSSERDFVGVANQRLVSTLTRNLANMEHFSRRDAVTEVWWNPEKLDTNTCCYLGLICRLFSVIMSGAGDGPAASSFRDLMKLLIQVHLREPVMLFRFLCVLWGYSSNHGDQLDVKVGAVLQTQALYMGGSLLSVQPAATLQELAAADSPVVPSLLCCLSSPVREVRRAALGALQSLSGVSTSPFQPIIEKLLKTWEEIIADPSYLSTVGTVVSFTLFDETQQKKLQAALQQLLQCVRTPCCPSYSAAALLRALGHVNGQFILSALLPVLDRLLEQSGPDTPTPLRAEAQLMQLVLGKYNEASAPLLAEDQNCLDLFIRALKTSTQPHADIPSCQIIALEQITKPFFSALGDDAVQQKLLSVMFDLLVEAQSPLMANTISSVFKVIAVDGQLVANELAPPEKPKVGVTVQQTRRSKMTARKPQESTEVGPEGGAVPWQRVTLILELLQHKKKLKRAQMVVPVLFSLLARSLEPGSVDQANIEYTKQLLLSCLLNVCHRLSPDGAPVAPDVLDEDRFSVELVVQCIRASDVPQTHHHALLLLGTVATIFPEKVLHNIMPIFTFMGANIMRLDDAYSFRVIDKTVQMVIPALIKLSDGSSSAHVDAVVTRIVHVFADALPHVPDHRRLPILNQLVTTLGPARFLWVLLLLLFKLHATQAAGAASEKDAALERDVDFWISLCCQFEVADQLTSLINILSFLLKKAEEEEEKVEELIFSLETHSSKELRHFKFLSVSFMAQLLGSTSFIGKVGSGTVHLSTKYFSGALSHLTLTNTFSPVAQVNALLPTDTFITVMRGLMGNQLASVRRKAMELLNNKLQHRTQWDEQQVTALLQLTTDLLSIVGKGHVKVTEEEAEQAINRQTALYTLKLLCRSFGPDHQEAFVPVLLQAVEIVTSEEEEKNVTGSALLCIAELVGTLKALAIPQLPRLMPAVLQTLTDRKELLTNEIYLLSVVTALQRVTETLPHFISPYLQDTTIQVTHKTTSSSSSSSSAFAQLSVRLASLRSTLATKLPPRVLLPTLSRCYSSMVVNRKVRERHGFILKEHIGHMDKDQVNLHQSELTSYFLTALDFRADHCQGDLQTTSDIEGCVIDCLTTMVMKLSEVTFRPLFFKLFDWSKSDSAERLLTFYRLCDCVAERLKGLFVLFAGNLVKPMSELLRQTNSSSTGELLFDCDEDAEKNSLLLQFVLDCLHKIFLYDTQRFLSRERADALLAPLVDQLENQVGGEQVYQQRVTRHLVPCVAQFAVALADDSQWKTLNYQVLLKTRHRDAKVRFSALLMLMELAAKLKENYMVLLPETIPFLAELMEDECEEVEQQVHKVIQEMENILGEPLQSYF
uniref:HEAT repeat-containing protein 1 n=1 Tax=Mastacembelus armatus TaxID=205130 RepID=A0A7N8XJX5_9TELE